MTFIKNVITGVTVLTTVTMSFAADFELPSQVTWTTYDTGSAGYNQAVAIGSALQNESGVSLRVLPGKNDVSRLQPLAQGRVNFSATSLNGLIMAQEAAFEFSAESWGPQDVRMLIINNSGETNTGLAVAGDLNITEYSELKGKRVSWIVGAPALNIITTATLSYAGLTWDDVEKVEFGGYGEAFRGMMSGATDTIYTVSNSGIAYEAASGPRGLSWPRIDAENLEGIARMKDMVPFIKPNIATVGAGIDGTEGVEGLAVPYPVLGSYSKTDADLVYNMLKAMDELYELYKDGAPGANGWAMQYQDMNLSVPYHEGAIRFYKEKGMWTDEDQAFNDGLIARQEILKKAWAGLQAQKPEDFKSAWYQARKEALGAAGLKEMFAEVIE